MERSRARVTLKQIGESFEARDGERYIGFIEPYGGGWRAAPARVTEPLSGPLEDQEHALMYLIAVEQRRRAKRR